MIKKTPGLTKLTAGIVLLLIHLPSMVFGDASSSTGKPVSPPAKLMTSPAESLGVPFPAIPIAPLENREEYISLKKTISEGQTLLEEKKWSEARGFFEKAARHYPHSHEVQRFFRESRYCVETLQRHNDDSFRSLVNQMTLADSLYLFDEVFNNILRYHVDTPHFNQLFQYGLDGMAVSFAEPLFQKRYGLSEPQAENLIRYCQILKNEASDWNLSNLRMLRETVSGIAELIEKGTKVAAPAIVMEFLCSVTTALDSYSAFLTKNQIHDIYSMIDGHFVGLGVELRTENGLFIITRVLPDSPAVRAGVVQGERIIAINGTVLSGLEHSSEAGSLLQGTEGSTAILRLLANDGKSQRDVSVVRQRVEVPSIEDVKVLNDTDYRQRIGYLRINCFQKTTTAELSMAINSLLKQQAEGVIIDLRHNPGGLLQEAIESVNLFIEQGMIVKTRGRMTERPYFAKAAGTYSIPLVVLIDSSSASASEIFAGAIREHQRGVIVGSRSYGKGTVQAIIQLTHADDPAAPIAGLRLTTEKFYSPTGYAYSGVGVEPNVEVEATSYPLDLLPQRPNNSTQNVAGSNSFSFQNVSRPITPNPIEENDLCLAQAFEEARHLVQRPRQQAP